jgi:hypothetical protein
VSGADMNSALSDKAKRDATIRDQHVAALRREHEAMSRHGRKERAKQIEAALKELGASVQPEPESSDVDATTEPEAAPVQASRKRTTTRA